jgi:hypothetical protein
LFTALRAASDDSNTTLLPSPKHRQQLLYEKVRRAHVDREEVVKVFDGRFFDGGRLGDARVRDQNIQPVAGQRAHPFCKLVRAIRGAQIGRDLFCAAARGANRFDD